MKNFSCDLTLNEVNEKGLNLLTAVHDHLDKVSCQKGVMIASHGDILGFRTIHLDQIPYGQGQLIDHIADVTANYLADRGIRLSTSEVKQHGVALTNAYQLLSCVSYYKLVNRNGNCDEGLVTKSAALLHYLSRWVIPADRKKSLTRFAEQCCVSRDELESGVFKAVKIEFINGRYKFKSISLNTKNKGIIAPYYQLLNGSVVLFNLLLKGEYRITYRDDTGREIEKLTSLNSDVLARWSNNNYKKPKLLRKEWWLTAYEGFIHLPDLQNPQDPIKLPLLGVVKVEHRSR